MLTLKEIQKEYRTGAETVKALNGISITFRKNEFVSILGPSGCGKTTLLNLIGGLDHPTGGELVIRGKSTRNYKEKDWDTYRNHTIGFVFQSYNLIPHQNILKNVELALTLSGVSREERRKRAENALARVGLADQLHKKPAQLSGGQMQRVAIARALINNPDVLLADEPTGALDSETSLQVMDLLQEIARDRLVIMVTHNPELAQQYSTRIVKLLDGRIVSDSNPCGKEEENAANEKIKRPAMSLFTALGLSFSNLLTKKTRTLLVSFAGSIGIIGIALILSLSSGFRAYISRVEEETLSGYPLTITEKALDTSSLLEGMAGKSGDNMSAREGGYLKSGEMMTEMFTMMMSETKPNDLKSLKADIEQNEELQQHISGLSYTYPVDLQVWSTQNTETPIQVNPSQVMDNMMGMNMNNEMGQYISSLSTMSSAMGSRSMNIWTELMTNRELLMQQYDVIAGRWPSEMNEIVLVVNSDNSVSELTLYTLGLKDQNELSGFFTAFLRGESIQLEEKHYTYEEILNLTYQLVLPTDYYKKENGKWRDQRLDETALAEILQNGLTLRVVGILRPSEDSVVSPMNGGSIGYLHELTEYAIEKVQQAEIVKEQLENPSVSVLTGRAFNTFTTLQDTLTTLGVADLSNPSNLIIYPKSFEDKQAITDYLSAYNERMAAEGKEDSVIRYTDYIDVLLSGITGIIDAITYVLIAFVAISLIVSSIMIGVITYISVLERTKEIGILRALGARKRDISRVFNAETLLIGLLSGGMGIGITYLLLIPINKIIYRLASIQNVAALPTNGAIILVCVSMLLTVIAGLIPSRIAAKRDPVVALRSEN